MIQAQGLGLVLLRLARPAGDAVVARARPRETGSALIVLRRQLSIAHQGPEDEELSGAARGILLPVRESGAAVAVDGPLCAMKGAIEQVLPLFGDVAQPRLIGLELGRGVLDDLYVEDLRLGHAA